MASKQLGKLRQWAGEVISSREKTQPSSEFVAMEQDMEVRKGGIEKLQIASKDYLEYISRTALSEAVPGEDKMMYTEALGVVMIGCGENLGDQSAFGRSLSMFGRARCRIAAIQNIYAVTSADTFLAHLGRAKGELEEYVSQRKKLESRRLAYDAAISKTEKAFKKEKDKKEAEAELEKAKLRYEEMVEDVRARMDAIRESEVAQQRELRKFLDLEAKFVEQYLGALKEVQSEWPIADNYSTLKKSGTASAFHYAISRTSSDSKESSGVKQRPPIPSRNGSHRSTRSVPSVSSDKKKAAQIGDDDEVYSEPDIQTAGSRPSSRPSHKVSGKDSRPPSRQSKARSRSASVETAGSTAAEMSYDTAPGKNSAKQKKPTGGVASWVGDAMTSVMNRNKSRVPDKEKFSTLDDDDGSGDDESIKGGRSRRLSNRSTKSNKSVGRKMPSRSRAGSESIKIAERKVMKALYDFSGGNDELSFRAGDEIVVVHEVLDDWWLGEAGGRKGLFPTNYAIVVKTKGGQSAFTKSRNASTASIRGLGQLTSKNSKLALDDEESRRTLVDASDTDVSVDAEDEYDGESVSNWHPFDDRHGNFDHQAHGILPDVLNQRGDPGFDADHDGFNVDDKEFRTKLSVSLAKLDAQQTASRTIESSAPAVDLSMTSSSGSPVKKMPPPPPPRRRVSNANTSTGPPPLPVRNLASNRTASTGSMLSALAPPGTEPQRARSESSSPFESQSELSFDTVATTYAHSKARCEMCDCEDFVEDPFRGHGLCAKCTHSHA